MKMRFLGRFREEGVLALRLGVGGMFLPHGWPKLAGGPVKWQALGKAMGYLGVHHYPEIWGLLAGLAEFGGGLCLILGWFCRPACLAMALTMGVAATTHLQRGDGLMGASHAIELGIVFIALALIGPGRYSIDRG